MSHAKASGWVTFLAVRWKAVAATVVPLIGGVLFLASTDQLDLKHLCGIAATALGSGLVTHQVPNATTDTSTTGTVVTGDQPQDTVLGGLVDSTGEVVDDVLPGDAQDTGK